MLLVFFFLWEKDFFFPCTYSKDPHPGRISINPSQQCCGFKDFPQLQDAVMLHNHWSALNEGFRGSSSYRFFGCQFPWATLTTQTPKRQPKALRWRWCLTGPLEHFLAYGWSSTEATAPRELVRGSEWTRSKANCYSLATLSHAISWNTSAHTYRNSSAVYKKTKSVNLLSPLTRECWAQLGFIFLHTAEEKQLKKWVTKLDSSLLTRPCQRNESFPAASATLQSSASPQHQPEGLQSTLQHPPTRASSITCPIQTTKRSRIKQIPQLSASCRCPLKVDWL